MRRTALLVLCLSMVPALVEAQTELGVDGGLRITGLFQDGSNLTQFGAPTGSLRVGVETETLIIETLASLNIVRAGGTTASALSLTPGFNFPIDENGTYARGELGLLFTAGGGSTDLDLGLGAAIGVKKPIEGGPFSYRFELGFHRWTGDLDQNRLRVLTGLSATIG